MCIMLHVRTDESLLLPAYSPSHARHDVTVSWDMAHAVETERYAFRTHFFLRAQ